MQVPALDGYHHTKTGRDHRVWYPASVERAVGSKRERWLLVDQMVLDEPLGCSLQMMPMPLPNPLASMKNMQEDD